MKLTPEPLAAPIGTDDPWTDLARRSRNIFATREFLGLWWQFFGRGGEARVSAARDDQGVVQAIVPLYCRRLGPVRIARFLGHQAADELGPLAVSDDSATEALDLALAAGGWDVLLGEQLPGDRAWAARLNARELSREGSPVLDLRGETWDSLLASWSAKLRRDVRGDERKLRERHGLAFRLATDGAALDADLDTLFRLHAARWPESAFVERESFHRAFARVAFDRGWLRLWFLELEGQPAATWYGFRFEGVESHFQVGRDPDWAKWGTGTLLSAHTIREAVSDGMREYRFLRGGEAYKYRFARADPGLVTVGRARGLVGRVALDAAATMRTLRRRMRARNGSTAPAGAAADRASPGGETAGR